MKKTLLIFVITLLRLVSFGQEWTDWIDVGNEVQVSFKYSKKGCKGLTYARIKNVSDKNKFCRVRISFSKTCQNIQDGEAAVSAYNIGPGQISQSAGDFYYTERISNIKLSNLENKDCQNVLNIKPTNGGVSELVFEKKKTKQQIKQEDENKAIQEKKENLNQQEKQKQEQKTEADIYKQNQIDKQKKIQIQQLKKENDIVERSKAQDKKTAEAGYQANQSIQAVGNSILAEKQKRQDREEQSAVKEANQNFNENLQSGKYVSEVCADCEGSGYIVCEKCDGTGGEKCYACDGKRTETCGMCSGTGNWLNQTCTICGGKGTKKCNTCDGEGFKKCWYCNGKRKTVCNNCKGVGKIMKLQQSGPVVADLTSPHASSNTTKLFNPNANIDETISFINEALSCCGLFNDQDKGLVFASQQLGTSQATFFTAYFKITYDNGIVYFNDGSDGHDKVFIDFNKFDYYPVNFTIFYVPVSEQWSNLSIHRSAFKFELNERAIAGEVMKAFKHLGAIGPSTKE